ncbi:MAG: prephenate dehydrogenase/arogenate dehydrogenase family protein [Anaerolineales bacterium]|nr:prephenate dehydrogenase/arogenate dehydrogenase family protein [Anaerolineales bacterium]
MATTTRPIITIIGLGVTGASLGLALVNTNVQADVVGHDKAPDATQAARKLGAITRGEWNLHNAVANASVVVLAIPLSEVDETLGLIAEDLQPSTMVIVLTDVLQPAATMLATRLPGHNNAVVGHPIVIGPAASLTARPDLLEKAVFVIAAGATTAPDALELASNFVETVGAQPLFMDPVEHDGIAAAVTQLPQLLSASLMHYLAGSPGWTEARRLAGRPFMQGTEVDKSAEHLYATLVANRANMLVRLDQFQRELAAWRTWLESAGAAESSDPLQTALADTAHERNAWEAQAQRKDWDPTPVADTSTSSHGIIRQLFLGNLGQKKTPPPKGD